jgi:hypothetical protein
MLMQATPEQAVDGAAADTVLGRDDDIGDSQWNRLIRHLNAMDRLSVDKAMNKYYVVAIRTADADALLISVSN